MQVQKFSFLLAAIFITSSSFGIQLVCSFDDIHYMPSDLKPRIAKTPFDRYEGESFEVNLINGEISGFKPLDNKTWRQGPFRFDPFKGNYSQLLISVFDQPFKSGLLAISGRKGRDIYFVFTAGSSIAYSGTCQSVTNL